MNIFVTSVSPYESAKVLDDKRVVKMILESAQLLSTAINHKGGQSTYKSTHINHPCAKWVRTSKLNYMWLFEHYMALCQEYNKRFNKIHKCFHLKEEFIKGMELMPDGGITPYPNCTIFKNENDVFKAYKKALLDKWSKDKYPPRWTNTEKPKWLLA